MKGILSWLFFWQDPVLRDPTLGCCFLCLGVSVVGVILFLRKETLLGEVLSHASYPGIALGALGVAVWSESRFQDELLFFVGILGGALLSCWLGVRCIQFLQTQQRIASDTALCFVLSSFFGVGLFVMSSLQFSFPHLYKQIFFYLYGQAATLREEHVWVALGGSLFVVLLVVAFYKEIQLLLFDPLYAKSLQIPVRAWDQLLLFVTTCILLIGMRSVGVVLMSGMVVAPAAAARQLTHRLSWMFVWAGVVGVLSGFLGNLLSVQGTEWLQLLYPGERLILPTGPVIILVACFFVCLAVLYRKVRDVRSC